ncbi:MAG: ABC transporter permease [Bilifractor sp.]|jgi:ribose transport system permease protein
MEEKKKMTAGGFFKSQALLFVGIIIFIVFGLIQNSFFTMANVVNIFRQIAVIAIMGAGMTYAIIGGNFDLSVGSLLSLCGSVAIVTTNEVGQVGAVIITILVGCLSGVVCGYLCGYLHLNSMVATLGMMNVLQALTLMYTNGQFVSLDDSTLPIVGLGQGNVGIVPVSVIVMAIFCVIFAIILNRTVFGHQVKAVGTNPETCKYSGINDNKVVMMTFVISGFSTAIAALLLSMRGAGAQPTMGLGYEFDVITAVILGGADLNGGEGSIYRSFVGALIIGIMKTGFVILGMSVYYQYVAECIIILLAVYMDIRAKKGGNRT